MSHRFRLVIVVAVVLSFVAGCGTGAPAPSPSPPAVEAAVTHRATTGATVDAASAPPTATTAPAPTEDDGTDRLTEEQVATLRSLEQVGAYPLYTMTYYGDYGPGTSATGDSKWLASSDQPAPAWACSLFAAMGDPDGMVYGRNFDWQYSPALLLFTDPPDGYASVSMVDIAYLGFKGDRATQADDVPLGERVSLLDTPFLPFDGMNEQGVAVGMAAVPSGGIESDPAKETVDSLMVIRNILDQASNVDEAVEILQSYNIAWGSGPPLHYLVADRSGRAMLVEFYHGEIVVIPNESNWHQATNFLRAAAGESAQGACGRYDRISQRLTESGGHIDVQEAMELLNTVAQQNTQWSVAYGMNSGDFEVVMGREYGDPHAFHLDLDGGAAVQ